MNRTRKLFNRRMRELFGFTQTTPEAGDKLVCLKNDRTKGLLNGSLWKVKTVSPMRAKKLRMSLTPDDDPNRKAVRVGVIPAFFESDDEIPYALRRDSDEFDFGYALTVDKSQGSQWDNVVLFDESGAFREHRNRWLYTGITRAAEKLTIVK
jgi:exodeoxyribonuclease-5